MQVADKFMKLISGKKPETCKLIVSSHNYENTPSAGELGNLVAQMQATAADIVKIATTATEIVDVARMFQILVHCQEMSAEMDKKTCRWKKFPLAKVFGPKDRKASSRGSMECSINSTVDFKDSPVESLVASSSASSSSFFKKFSENRSIKLSGFSTCTEAFRIFAATWNVAGQTPDMELNLNDLLSSDDHSDIYALGFQEVVSLNAGNVLVIEDNEPAARWLTLVDQALNRRDYSGDQQNWALKLSLSNPPTICSQKGPCIRCRNLRGTFRLLLSVDL
ncbi:hypothetical protein ABZP36_028135 [Zizania latifolia]